MDTPVQLIVGLGNPGPQYERTRHNAGADFVMALANHFGVTLKADNKYSGLTGKAVINGKPVWLLIPTTFMNRSGKAIAALAGFYQIRPEAILVAHDELDLNPGIARFKLGGGHGGHGGIPHGARPYIPRAGPGAAFMGIGGGGHIHKYPAYHFTG